MPGSFGRLSVKGSQLVGSSGQKAMLRGISTHGIQWFPQYVNQNCFKTLQDKWRINAIRLAMYVEEGGYVDDRAKSIAKMYEGIEACLTLGLYVVVDWHVSNADQTPMKHIDAALGFFKEITERYKDNEQIIYEICNEPNNAGNEFYSQIKPYADQVIPLIRASAPSSVIIIGNSQWSQMPLQAWEVDAHRQNVLYTLHRYCDGNFDTGWWANANNGWSPEIKAAVGAGCPIIATECGVSNSGEWNWNTSAEFEKIIAFYESLGISWMVWSLSDKVEPSSILNPNAPTDGQWSDANISKAGHIVKDLLLHLTQVPQPPAPAPEPQPQPQPPTVDPLPAPAPPPSADQTATVTLKITRDAQGKITGFTGEICDGALSLDIKGE